MQPKSRINRIKFFFVKKKKTKRKKKVLGRYGKKRSIIDRYRTRVIETNDKKKRKEEEKETPSRLAAGDKTKKNGQGKKNQKRKKRNKSPRRINRDSSSLYWRWTKKPQKRPGSVSSLKGEGGPDRRPGFAGIFWRRVDKTFEALCQVRGS